MLRRREIRRRVDGRARLLEDPVVYRRGRAVGRHQILEGEGEPAAARSGVPHHDRLEACRLRLGQQVLKLGDCLRRRRHADLLGEFLVVEDAGQAVVQPGGVQRAGATGSVAGDPVLGELCRRELIPAERGDVVVEVLQECVLDQAHH